MESQERVPGDSEPDHSEVVVADRLGRIDDFADEVLRRGRRRNTRAAFDQDWEHWRRFCATQDLAPQTVHAGMLVAFVAYLAVGGPGRDPQAPETIRRRLTGVLAGWKERKLDVPHGITSKARQSLDVLERRLAEENEVRGRGASPAVTIPQLRRMCDALPVNLFGHRDRCLLLIGFSIAARRSELANLLVSDVTPDPDGLVVNVRSGKTPREVAVKPGVIPSTDPIRAWRRWLDESGVRDGHALRRIHHTGSLQPQGITPQTVGAVVTSRGEAAGVYGLTGHSLRSGLATEARRAGHDRKTIAAQTGHSAKSAILDGYMQIVDRWADNALTGIGL